MTSFKDDILQTLLLAIFATIIGFGIVLLLVQLAPASSLCLSKKEARELWPKRHIYWYSKDHCWSNRRGPPRNLKIDPIKNNRTQALASEPGDKDYCCWPKLPRDEAGQIVQPPPTFGERWNQIIDVFRSMWKGLTND
jgi:hypothetical protein